MNKYLLIIISLFITVQGLIAQEQTCTVELKNGRVLKGIRLEDTPSGFMKIKCVDGQVYAFKKDQIANFNGESSTIQKSTYTKSKKTGEDKIQEGITIGFRNYNYDITGYRGFVDIGYTVGLGDFDLNRINFSTSHGYQFNPYLFVGIGIGAQYFDDSEEWLCPIFADVRCNIIKNTPLIPFIGIKGGYSFYPEDSFEDVGAYINPSVGAKYMISSKCAVNLSVGYTAQLFDYVETINSGAQIKTTTKNMGGFTISAGFEF